MKKITLILLVLALTLSMTACTGTTATTTEAAITKAADTTTADAAATTKAADASAATTATSDKPFTVGLAFGGLDATPTVLMGYLTDKMDALGWKYIVTNGDLDVNKYIADVESLCQQKPDLIVTRPVNDTVNASIVPIADAAKIPLAFMSSMTVVPGYKYLGHVADPELIRGIPLAEWINKYVADHPGFVPKIGFLVGAAAIDSKGVCERSINIRDYLTCDWKEVISAEADPNWSAAGGMKVTEDWLQKYTSDELNTIVCWSDEMSVGVVQALQAAGKNPDDYLVLSYDGLPIVQDYVQQGWIDATSALGLEKVADTIIELCQKVKDGKSDQIDFMTYADSIYVMDSNNVAGLKDGSIKPTFWDYSKFKK